MSYGLMIADDEAHIRDGLSELIDWESLGFHVEARMQDGQQLLDSLQTARPDVILTDIRMPGKNGLDVAEHVFRHRLPVKVVLISGYRDFEFAQQAVNYKVYHYLLKPTRLPDIQDVFVRIKAELDEERQLAAQLLAAQTGQAAEHPGKSVEEEEASLEDASFPPELPRALWLERQRALFSYVQAGNYAELGSLFRSVADEAIASGLPLRLMQNLLIDLFSALSRKQHADGLASTTAGGGASSGISSGGKASDEAAFHFETVYKKIFSLTGLQECRGWALDSLRAIEEAEQQRLESFQPQLIAEAKAYVALHYREEITLKAIAGHVHLSPDYFSRLFRQHTGLTLTDYMLDYRMSRAMEHLQQTELKVYEIGDAVGYPNPKYFFKLFKKHTGFTPNEYRKRASLQPNNE